MSAEAPEGWHSLKIGKFSDVISGSTPDTSNPRYWDGDIIWITPDDLSKNSRVYIEESSRKISYSGLKNSSAKIIPGGSIVISSRAPIGYLAIVPSKYTTNQGCKSLHIRDSAITEFVYYSLIFNMNKVKQKGEGTTFAEISKKDLEEVYILLPKSLPEQKKIAMVMMSIDIAINKTTELIDKYRRMKQGLMQDFFNNADKQSIDDKLLVITLGNREYFELATGGTPSTGISEYWGGAIKWMASGEIHKKRIYDVNGRITDKGYENSNATLIPRNSILIALAGQGKTRGTVAISKTELTTNQSVAAVILKKGKIDPEYLYHYLDNKYLELRSISAGAGRAGLSLSILAEYPIKVHAELDEQKRIAQILDKIDERIQSEESYQNKLVKMKNGLMQDLLTGKVRVAA
jgi:type I restriction enzyme S subunit